MADHVVVRTVRGTRINHPVLAMTGLGHLVPGAVQRRRSGKADTSGCVVWAVGQQPASWRVRNQISGIEQSGEHPFAIGVVGQWLIGEKRGRVFEESQHAYQHTAHR